MASMSIFETDLSVAQMLYTAILADQERNVVNVTLAGAEGTPYQGGVFEVEIDFGNDYPNQTPKAIFLTRVWSPAVNPRTSEAFFEPVTYNVTTAIEYLETVLKADLGKKSNRTAEFWTHRFAGRAEDQSFHLLAKIEYVMEVGFPEESAFMALSIMNFNVQDAIEELCDNDDEDITAPWIHEESEVRVAPMAHGEPGPSGIRRAEDTDEESDDDGEGPSGEYKIGEESADDGAGPSNI